MSKAILICGYGPGISRSIARKFGRAGFSVGIVSRNAEGLVSAVHALAAEGVQATGFPADLSAPHAIRPLMESVRAKLGQLNVLQWNAYGAGAGDLLTADAEELHQLFELPITSFVMAVQECLPELRKAEDSAVLVTNSDWGLFDRRFDTIAVEEGAMGLAVACAAKHKAVRVLAEKLKPEGVYVGEVIVRGTVKGTPWDDGTSRLEADTVAAKFWEVYKARPDDSVEVGLKAA